jgi:hypothetical protein
MAYQLVVTKGRSTTQTLKVPVEGVTTVGRQQGCQIRVASSQVSRKHCELFEKKGLLLVKDLNSSNGTYVDGKRVQGQQVLEHGNTLTIGGVSFRIEQLGAAAAPAPAAAPAGPGDTAVPMAAEVGGDADIELDFEIAAEDDDATILNAPAPAKPAAAAPAPAATAAPAPAAAPEPEPTTPAAGDDDFLLVPEGADAPEIGEDAVADYLLNIDLDDEDKV